MQNRWYSSRPVSIPGGQPGDAFDVEVVQQSPSLVVLKFSGSKATDLFRHEGGGHRWQRVPDTEKRGRVQSSSLTVAVLDVPMEHEVYINPRDCVWQVTRGSGAGGQHRNTTDSAVRLTHKPTGIVVWCEGERSQRRNKETALSTLRARIGKAEQKGRLASRARERKRQVGSGQRGDKRRTIRLQAGDVQDHVLGRKLRSKEYLRGKLDSLYI